MVHRCQVGKGGFLGLGSVSQFPFLGKVNVVDSDEDEGCQDHIVKNQLRSPLKQTFKEAFNQGRVVHNRKAEVYFLVKLEDSLLLKVLLYVFFVDGLNLEDGILKAGEVDLIR